MGNRPINRRPWRRPPWRKSRRPAVWRDGNSLGTLDAFGGAAWGSLGPPNAFSAVPTTREVLAGDVDALYLDKAEVRVDRIVGDIQFFTASSYDGALALPPVVRFAFIVEEDPANVSTLLATATYNLWDADALRDAEWMYLEQPAPTVVGGQAADGTGYREVHWHSHIDLRVKRNLGKADRLFLVMTYGNGLEGGAASSNLWATPVYYSYMLRSVLVT